MYGLGLISKTDGQTNQLYYLADGLGSTTGLADGQGDVVGTYNYDVFGAIRSQSGASENPWLFTGEQRDNESDLYYLRARYYDPSTGRFLTQDPMPFLNRYSYVRNNPALYVDPYGLWGNPFSCSNPLDCGKDLVEGGGDVAGAVVDRSGDAAEFVDEHVVQPTADFLSDPENILSAAQIGSGYVAQVMCEGGMDNPVCWGALAVYGVASAGKVALADSRCEAWITAGSAALGAPVWPGGPPAYVAAGVSGLIEGVGCTTPVYAYTRTNSKE